MDTHPIAPVLKKIVLYAQDSKTLVRALGQRQR